MICSSKPFIGKSKCQAVFNPIKGIEVIFITNKEAKLNAVMHDGSKNPINYHDDISLVLDGETFRFERMDENIFRTTKELF